MRPYYIIQEVLDDTKGLFLRIGLTSIIQTNSTND